MDEVREVSSVAPMAPSVAATRPQTRDECLWAVASKAVVIDKKRGRKKEWKEKAQTRKMD